MSFTAERADAVNVALSASNVIAWLVNAGPSDADEPDDDEGAALPAFSFPALVDGAADGATAIDAAADAVAVADEDGDDADADDDADDDDGDALGVAAIALSTPPVSVVKIP